MTLFRRRYDNYTTSHRIRINAERTLSVQGDATLQNNKLCQKYFCRIFSNGTEQLSCRKSFGEHLFCILNLCNNFQRLLLVDTTNKKVYWEFGILVSGFCNVQLYKAKSKNEIFLVIKTIDLIWNTFLSLCMFRENLSKFYSRLST